MPLSSRTLVIAAVASVAIGAALLASFGIGVAVKLAKSLGVDVSELVPKSEDSNPNTNTPPKPKLGRPTKRKKTDPATPTEQVDDATPTTGRKRRGSA